MAKDMAKGSLLGIMVRFLKDNGEMAKRMALAFGNHPKETLTKVNGRIIDRLAQESIFTMEGLSIMDNSKIF